MAVSRSFMRIPMAVRLWDGRPVAVGCYLITLYFLVWKSDRVKFLPRSLPLCDPASSTTNMPRATSDRFSRRHDPSVKSAAKRSEKKQSNESSGPSSSGTRNPIFNTERFGQHILKNPLVAQGWVLLLFLLLAW